ncbi:DUF4232 domain-containing protein [Rhodococcus sp. OK302]|uniref:DUF4232 domain-containing protein n=1 Tax=Rhodococcus sp. OK302 TaxID=1882769 RepID=UPI000B93F46A|nr:DUF4232 domain-containing protein [Rhodococcus sp. OK302]OYD67055.1 uncharacterized protein DUF4232 [Rhodococcus sp. OK302]
MSPTQTRRIVLFAAPLATLALVSGCGSDSSDTAASSSVPTTTSALPTSAAPAPTSHAEHSQTTMTMVPNPQNCTVGELTVTLGQAGGAAGSTELPLVFTNTSSRTCNLDGFPGVSYVTVASGNPVGAPATRSGSGSVVSLAPGSAGTAMVRATNVENYPADQCGVTEVAGLQVYPPNSYDSVFVPYPTKACSMTGANINQLSVAPVTS